MYPTYMQLDAMYMTVDELQSFSDKVDPTQWGLRYDASGEFSYGPSVKGYTSLFTLERIFSLFEIVRKDFPTEILYFSWGIDEVTREVHAWITAVPRCVARAHC